jgi:hypothetical protein
MGARGTVSGTVVGVRDYPLPVTNHFPLDLMLVDVVLFLQIATWRWAQATFSLKASLVGGREESFGAQAKLSPILEVQIF